MYEEETCLVRIKNTGMYAHLSQHFPDGSMSFHFKAAIQGAAMFTIENADAFIINVQIAEVKNEDLEKVSKNKAMDNHGAMIRKTLMN